MNTCECVKSQVCNSKSSTRKRYLQLILMNLPYITRQSLSFNNLTHFTIVKNLNSSEHILELLGQLEVPESSGDKALEAFGDPEGPKVWLIHQMTSSENHHHE